jgi:hypothetical protein
VKSRPRRPPQGLTRQDIFSVLGALGAIVTLVTAVMFYFGWRRTRVQATAMNIDESLFGFSTQDYVLRSVSSLYVPLLIVMGLGLAWVRFHSYVLRLLRSDLVTSRDRRATALRLTRIIAIAGVVLAVACLLFTLAAGVQTRPPAIAWLAERLRDRLILPMVLVVSTLTAAYAMWIHRRLQARHQSEERHAWEALLSPVLVAGVVVLGTLWILEDYATAVGRGYARQFAADVTRLPRAVVISPAPLGIRAPGVSEERLGTPGSPETRYRTTGLRLMARSGGKVLLVHDGWAPRRGTVIVLPDSDDLSWQFSATTS